MSVLTKCAEEVSSVFTENFNRDDFFNDLVIEKLSGLCKSEEDDLDDTIKKLELNVNSKNVNQVRKCVNRLCGILRRDRSRLVISLWRLMQ